MAARIAAAVCASTLAVGCVGFGLASTGGTATANAASAVQVSSQSQTTFSSDAASSPALSESVALQSTARRDISQGIAEIEAEEERARIAAEEAARAAERASMAAAEEAKARAAANGAPQLPDVDFSCGKEAFVAEWSARIDAYLAGSPLQGYGATFAAAAFDNGVDPRWSPAISNTESTKGRNCFRPYNAWGWMAESWSSWDEAINAHIAGLARGYGYTITVANAKKYCPPTYLDWYAKTLSEMTKI